MSCDCFDRKLVPTSCANDPLYRNSVMISNITPDELATRYVGALATAIHQGNFQSVTIDQQPDGNWRIMFYAKPPTCATSSVNYLFRLD